jgi:hypothetical protein
MFAPGGSGSGSHTAPVVWSVVLASVVLDSVVPSPLTAVVLPPSVDEPSEPVLAPLASLVLPSEPDESTDVPFDPLDPSVAVLDDVGPLVLVDVPLVLVDVLLVLVDPASAAPVDSPAEPPPPPEPHARVTNESVSASRDRSMRGR